MIEAGGAFVPAAICLNGYFIRDQLHVMQAGATPNSRVWRLLGSPAALRTTHETTFVLQALLVFTAFGLNSFVFLSADIPQLLAAAMLGCVLLQPIMSFWLLLLPQADSWSQRRIMATYICAITAYHATLVVVSAVYIGASVLHYMMIFVNILNVLNFGYLLTPPPRRAEAAAEDSATEAGFATHTRGDVLRHRTNFHL
mgnify:CR=1 FL=1